MAFGLGILSICLRYYLLSDQRIKNHIEKGPYLESFAKNHWKDKLDHENLQELKKLAKHEQRLVTLPRWVFNRSVLSWGINSFIVFTGYIVGILTKSFTIIIPFGGRSTLLGFCDVP